MCSFRERPYEVVEYCPRMHLHAETITDEDARRMLNSTVTAGCHNHLFYLVLLEKRIEFILAADTM